MSKRCHCKQTVTPGPNKQPAVIIINILWLLFNVSKRNIIKKSQPLFYYTIKL